MSLSLRLDLRQSQSLVMTPQLQQAIKLLQLSNLELASYVEGELEQNPLLERQEEPDPAVPEAEAARAEDGGEPGREPDASAELNGGLEMSLDGGPGDGWSGASEDGWSEPGPANGALDGLAINGLAPFGRGGSTDFGDDAGDFEARLSRPKTLREHLVEQLVVDLPAGPERLIGLHLIDLVDEAGYLSEALGPVAERLGCPEAQVAAVLARLQLFDPPGVCARSLRECLALQLQDRDRLDPAMAALLDHLDLLAQAEFPGLIRACGVLPEDLPEMIAELKALNPKPGQAFAQDLIEAVVPDIFVLPTQGGGWRVELNNATLPKVLINRAYHAELARQPADRHTRDYVSERLQTANWLVKALDQRARTILRVAEAVVARQLPFLQHGVHRLRPLVLREIAAAVELHESTVSRATADKYVATPRGNFPFRYFFSNALPGTDGDASHSAEAIRQQVKTMIEREDRTNVLSDDQIIGRLRTEGIVIARRTVAKYRESLGIPSSVERRRAKALRLA
ncbi:MAG: polymerase factor sigma-54 [Geminicoccaceae bacterium]|nr:polymerase factor sigma-54 [Geminicoccaceae bacterium]